MKTLTFIAILFMLSSCSETKSELNTETNKEKPVTKKLPFELFVESIPVLESSFKLSTNEVFKHIESESKFIAEGGGLIGRLKSIGDYHFIIYSYPADIQLPILEVYNSNGEKMSSKELFHYGLCTLDLDEYAEFSIINQTEIHRETRCSDDSVQIKSDTIYLNDLIGVE